MTIRHEELRGVWGAVRATSRAGRRITYRDTGGLGPVLLLVMGLGADSTRWRAHVDAWSNQFRCVGVDNCGTGGSEAGGEVSVASMAEDCFMVVEAVGAERVVPIGISMGGAIVQELVIQHPDCFMGQVLVGTWAEPSAYMGMAFQHLGELYSNASPGLFTRALQLMVWGPDYIEANREALNREIGADPSGFMPEAHFRAQVDACMNHNTVSRLPTVTSPALVTHGTEDRLVPLVASRLLSHVLPSSTRREFEGRAHAHHWEAGTEFNDAVVAWLRDLV